MNIELAKKEIDRIFRDTSVTTEETLEKLEDIKEYVEEKCQALQDDLDGWPWAALGRGREEQDIAEGY